MIHGGLYYGPNTLKTALCVKGKHMMYDLCAHQNIPHRNTKKWIVAQTSRQHEELCKIHQLAQTLGVPTRFIPLSQAYELEPDVFAREAILESSTTGIVDSHALMSYLEASFIAKGGDLVLNTSVQSIESSILGGSGYQINTIFHPTSETASITTETLINSAGLAAVSISNQILPASRQITPFYAKGTYYSYSAPTPRPKILVYPAPTTGAAGLGTHLTMDLAGRIRFGPDVEWVDDPSDLSVSQSRVAAAVAEIRTYLPYIQGEKVTADYCGIRPKLGKGGAVAGGKGDGFSDFIIRKEDGFDGFINLLGIESPGLTSSLAIAERVDDLLYK